MSKLKLDKARLRMEQAESKLDKAEIKVSQRKANRKLYEKARPSEKLHDKPKPSEKLVMMKKGRLSPECDSNLVRKAKPQVKGNLQRKLEKAPQNTVRAEMHKEISKHEEDNLGVKAAHQTEKAVEQSARFVNYTLESIYRKNKLRPFNQLETAEKKLHKAEQKLQKKTVNYRFQKHKLENSAEYSQSSTISKFKQKQKIKKAYAQEYRLRKMGKSTSTAGKTTSKATSTMANKVLDVGKAMVQTVSKDPKIWLIALGVLLIFVIISALFSAGSLISQGINSSTTITTYTADDSDILQVEANYNAKEQALQNRIDNIESEFSGYDEYRYNLSEIGHDPHDLAALLTALYHAYTPSEVSAKLDEIFTRQYNLTTVASTETRYDTDGNPYTWNVLTVTLTNTAISILASEFLTDDEYEHYQLLRATKGNKPDLFGDYSGSGSGDLSYSIPSHYLTDDMFASLMAEATLYLGYPYVWGGSSPSTSFDCSGFVCWVLRASGVWNISRTTAQGIFNQCITIPASERQAGDIIFFTGTYNSVGAVSHVGIYVGDGMMIHCGNPISYASVDSGYWTNYFYAYGRIP